MESAMAHPDEEPPKKKKLKSEPKEGNKRRKNPTEPGKMKDKSSNILRRSERKRKRSVVLREDYSTELDLHETESPENSLPRREGLRPRRGQPFMKSEENENEEEYDGKDFNLSPPNKKSNSVHALDESEEEEEDDEGEGEGEDDDESVESDEKCEEDDDMDRFQERQETKEDGRIKPFKNDELKKVKLEFNEVNTDGASNAAEFNSSNKIRKRKVFDLNLSVTENIDYEGEEDEDGDFLIKKSVTNIMHEAHKSRTADNEENSSKGTKAIKPEKELKPEKEIKDKAKKRKNRKEEVQENEDKEEEFNELNNEKGKINDATKVQESENESEKEAIQEEPKIELETTRTDAREQETVKEMVDLRKERRKKKEIDTTGEQEKNDSTEKAEPHHEPISENIHSNGLIKTAKKISRNGCLDDDEAEGEEEYVNDDGDEEDENEDEEDDEDVYVGEENDSLDEDDEKVKNADVDEEEDEEEELDEDEEDEDEEEEEEDDEEESDEFIVGRGRKRYHLRNRRKKDSLLQKTTKLTRSKNQDKKEFRRNKSLGKEEEGVRNRGVQILNNDKSHSPGKFKKKKRAFKLNESDEDDSLLVDETDPGLKLASIWKGDEFRFGEPSWTLPGAEPLGPAGWATVAPVSGWNKQADWLGTSQAGATGTATPGISAAPWSTMKGPGPGSSLKPPGGDVQPVKVDESVSFDDVGGLSQYINSLKEMVFFPLLYPDFFAKFHIHPPRGVLLCGPPGTGKTLVVRALAAAGSRAGKKITFFMRKGADILSKWVGEAEKQLKMLFEEAQKHQPSIVFFDEIDGLAPVRSSKQEQIHNSIVSTLLALMDGLDSRGQVVVIGATNRVDAIDSALRRPGRFDREFEFPLPNETARSAILNIHTRKWPHPLAESLKKELAESTVGYCGADIKALCTEAAIQAFRATYPHAYDDNHPPLASIESVHVEKEHFFNALSSIVPSSRRSGTLHTRPLPIDVAPCLKRHVEAVLTALKDLFPPLSESNSDFDGDEGEDEEKYMDKDSFYESLMFTRHSINESSNPLRFFTPYPRMLVCGNKECGQEFIFPAILHALEKFPLHSLSLPSLLTSINASCPEEALVHVVREAHKNLPSIIFLPHVQLWWETVSNQLKSTLIMLLSEISTDIPILLIGCDENSSDEIDDEILSIFNNNVYEITIPSKDERNEFFSPLFEEAMCVPAPKSKPPTLNPSSKSIPTYPAHDQSNPDSLHKNGDGIEQMSSKMLGPSMDSREEELKDKDEKFEKKLNKLEEIRIQSEKEENSLRRMRMCLRDVCNRILHEKKFALFHMPVDESYAQDYLKIISDPMDVTTLLKRVDAGFYMTRCAFLKDVDLIYSNAKNYNRDDYNGNRIISRACSLKDTVYHMVSQIDPNLIKHCEEISSRGGVVQVPEDIVKELNVCATELNKTASAYGSDKENESKKVTKEGNSKTKSESDFQGNTTKDDVDGYNVTRMYDEEGVEKVERTKKRKENGPLVEQSNELMKPGLQTNDLHHDAPQMAPNSTRTEAKKPAEIITSHKVNANVSESEKECRHVPDVAMSDVYRVKSDQVLQQLISGSEGFSFQRLHKIHRQIKKLLLKFRKTQDRSIVLDSLWNYIAEELMS